MSVILGIDPGSRITGYGVIESNGSSLIHVASGIVRTAHESFPMRLRDIFLGISTVINSFHPTEAAVEQVFVRINVDSALKLGHARGASLVALAESNLPVSEYLPRQVKKAIVGYGAADKNQMRQMIKRLLNLQKLPTSDAADALAVAICHAHMKKITAFSFPTKLL